MIEQTEKCIGNIIYNMNKIEDKHDKCDECDEENNMRTEIYKDQISPIDRNYSVNNDDDDFELV